MRPPRLSGFTCVGVCQYFLTLCTHERRRHFTSADLIDAVWLTLLRTGADQEIAIPAYCFMPDHLHILAEGETASADLRAFINIAKQRAAMAPVCG